MSQAELIFYISTHIPGYHPGIVRLQEKTERSMRDIGERYSSGLHRLFALPSGRDQVLRYLAETIYDDQTYDRQSGSHSGPRFTFRSPCRLHLIQRVGPGGKKTGKAPSWRKHEMVSFSLSGGQTREEICQQLATAMESWWEDPGTEAFISPDQFASETGAVLYDDEGERYEQIATFWHNGELIEAPVVFLAWQGDWVVQFATFHRGFSEQGLLFTYYRLFAFLHLQREVLLLDAGPHLLNEPILLPAPKGAFSPISYHLPWELGRQNKLRVIGGTSEWSSYDMYGRFTWLTKTLATARSTYSLYCTECRQGFLWEVGNTYLHDLAGTGKLPSVCEHTYFCPTCERWSTPTTRSARYTVELERCQHGLPPGKTHRIPFQPISPRPRSWNRTRVIGPDRDWREEEQDHSSRTDEFSGIQQAGDVIVVFLPECCIALKEPWHTFDIHRGTTLFGRWSRWQPEDRNTYRIMIGDNPWVIPAHLVSICCPLIIHDPALAQGVIAQRSFEEAEAWSAQGERQAAVTAYERALFEYSKGCASAFKLTTAQSVDDELRVDDRRVEGKGLSTEEVARRFERACAEPYLTDPAAGSVQSKQVVNALLQLGQVYHDEGKPATHLQGIAQRLLAFESSIDPDTEEDRGYLIKLRLLAAQLYASCHEYQEMTRLLRLVEEQFEALSEAERERVGEQYRQLKRTFYPERDLQERLIDALARLLGVSVDTVKEQERTLLAHGARSNQQRFSVYLRANKAGLQTGEIDLEVSLSNSDSQLLPGGKALRVRELVWQQGPWSAADMLSETIYRGLRALSEQSHDRETAVDFKQEMTLTFGLQVGVLGPARTKRTLRFASQYFGTSTLAGGMPVSEACVQMAGVLEQGVLVLDAVNWPAADPLAEPSDIQAGAGAGENARETGAPPSKEHRQFLSRIRQHGLQLAEADLFRDHAWDLYIWIHAHLVTGEGNSCWQWSGESNAHLGVQQVNLEPRRLTWALFTPSVLPPTSDLWPRCGNHDCIRPEHMLEVISIHQAGRELETRLGGKENAHYAIEDGKSSGTLPVQASDSEEERFARADFDLWRTSSAFAMRYLSGRVVAGGGKKEPDRAAAQLGQGGLKPRFEQIEEKQRQRIAALWGVRPARGVSSQKLAQAWVLSHEDRLAARFVWQGLEPRERTVLFSVLGVQSETCVRRPDLLRQTGLAPEELDAALDHLESLLLLHISYVPHPNREDLWQMIDYAGYGWALREAGEEFFSSQDRTQLTLSEHLTSLPSALISEVAGRYGFAPPRTSSEVASLCHTILEALLDQPGRVFTELGRLDERIQRLAALVYEHGGKVPSEQAATVLETDLPSLCEQLRAARSLCLLHEAFAPGGERVIFVPSDFYKASRRHSAAPRTRQQLDDFLTPTYAREGQPWLLYDLAAYLWFVYHTTMEPTQDDFVPVRIATKMLPHLHLLPRESSEGKERRVDLLDFLAWYYSLEKKSAAIAGVKKHYLPGEQLERWARLDLATQTRLALVWWLQMHSWADPVPPSCRERDIIQQHKEARRLLVSALQLLEPGRWYAVGDLLHHLWERHPTALRGGRTSAQALTLERWMRAEGAYYSALLASTLHELGIVALGYHQVPDRDLVTRLSPDLLQVTDTGRAALASTLEHFPAGAPPPAPVPEKQRPLLVQPTFEIIFLVPDLSAVYKTMPFTELQQIERTSRMRLSQSALNDALAQGWSVEQVIATLSELMSQKELAQNIVYSLREWASKHQSARLSQAVLIEVPSEAIADAVCRMEALRLLGVRKAGPCCLAVLGPDNLLDVRQALLKQGVAVRIVTEKG